MPYESELKNLGLSDKETKVYLASLELGAETMLKIARIAGVNRPTTYVQVESLIKKGLMSSFVKGKKRYFSAEPPERLLGLVDIARKDFEEKEKSFKNILPELKNVFDVAGERPRVRFYEGREGFQAIIDDVLRSKFKSMEEFTSLEDAYKVFPPHPKDHRHKILAKFKKIPMRVIYASSQKPAILQAKSRFVPKEKFPFSTDITIYGEKVAIFSLRGKLIGTIIESKEIADTLRAIFDLTWESSEKYQK
jgi:sugar-specific transcriptional regulator TrmB